MRPVPFGVSGLILAAAFAGCGGPMQTAPNQDVRNGWVDQAEDHGAMGVPATFALGGDGLYLFGEGTIESIDTPATFHAKPRFADKPGFLFFGNATVAGLGTGLLVLEGDTITAGAGTLRDVAFAQVTVVRDGIELRLGDDAFRPKSTFTFPAGWEEADSAYFFSDATPARAEDLALAGFERGLLITSSSAQDVAGAIVVQSSDVLYWDPYSNVTGARVDVDLGAFAVGGHVESGALAPAGRSPVAAPKGVFGHDARVRAEPGRIATTGEFRLTQALLDEGLLLPADAELLPESDSVSVARGDEAWFSVSFRERGYLGDAVLKDVRVGGDGQALVEIPLQRPPTHVQALWDIVEDVAEDAPWAAAFVAIPVAIATPFVALVDFFIAVACAFTTCPEDHPYPIWMDAGEVGVFYFKVKGDLAPGTYDVVITFEGQNHDEAEFSLAVMVEAA